MKFRKAITVGAMALVMGISTVGMTGCKSYKALDTGVSGEVTFMTWGGDGLYHEDLGNQNWTPDDITGNSQAALYATAKEFNKIYPNVKINLFSKAGDPGANETSWAQEKENFKAEHGKYPDVFATKNLVDEMESGLIADLSVFKDDPMYKSFNKSMLDSMNIYGFQAGLPSYMLPWGVFINKELAEQNNIDVPSPKWTIDEYTAFVSSADNKTFWGAMDAPTSFISSGTKTIDYQAANYKGTGDRINLNSDEVKEMLDYIPKWSKSAVYPQHDIGNVDQSVMEANGWWSFNFFVNNRLLTLEGDPWMMGAAASSDKESAMTAKSNNWDIYPRPSTKYQPNTVGIVIDAIAVSNYAMDDGDPAWSEAELEKFKIAYTFAAFLVGDTNAMKARAEQMYSSEGGYASALNDSLPLVSGKAFDEQMEIWYSSDNHKRFADKALMPGWHEIIDIYNKGQFWIYSDIAVPSWVNVDGTDVAAFDEWWNIWNPEIVGARRTDANWVDQVKAKLPDWNTAANARFGEADGVLREAMKTYYSYTDDMFK